MSKLAITRAIMVAAANLTPPDERAGASRRPRPHTAPVPAADPAAAHRAKMARKKAERKGHQDPEKGKSR